MPRIRVLAGSLLLSVLPWTAALAAAQDGAGRDAAVHQSDAAPAPVLRIPRVSRPPRLEQFLEGLAREAEVRVDDFRQYEPADGAPATRQTTAYLSYDATNLYVVFVCKDDPAAVRARLARREDIDADDKVVLHLDTFHDHRHAYSFLVNPLGVQLDGLWTEGQGRDDTFDTLWYSRGRLTADGYIVWIAVPFKSLRFTKSGAQRWGIALGRAIRRNNEMAMWPFITQRRESYAAQFATIENLDQISPGRNVQVIPYGAATGGRFLDRATPAPQFTSSREARAGVDAKAVFGGAMALDATLNPDFSQVESDEPQVTVNQRFEVFFPEKRPFFLENASIFQTPINLFFSRRVIDPRVGARLTGKRGSWNVGVIGMDDRAVTTSPAAGLVVARVQRDFTGQSNAGVLFTERRSAGAVNRIVSLDARLKFGENWVATLQSARSDTRDPAKGSAAGTANRFELAHAGRHLAYAARYVDYSPTFRSDLGFIQRVDVRQVEQSLRYYWRPERMRVLLFGPDVTATVNWNRQGVVQDWSLDAAFGGDFKGPTGAGCRHVAAYELFSDIGFHRHMTDCGINSGWIKWLEVTADYGWGSAVNYAPAFGVAPFAGDAASATIGITFRPSPRLRIAATYLYTRLALRSATSDARPGTHVFDNHIARARLHYQFTRELSLRAIFDYNGVLPDRRLVALERSKRVAADILFTYLLNPGTALYIGYTDAFENVDVAFTPDPTIVRLTDPRISVGRQVFAKVSYLLRF